MSWAFVAHRGSAQNKVAASSISMNPTANINVGEICVVRVVADNYSGASAVTNWHSVSDNKGNSWTKIREHTISSGGAANDGVTASLFISRITAQILTTDAITAAFNQSGFSFSPPAKAIGAAIFSNGGGTISVVGANSAIGTGTAPSVTLSGLTSAEYLWLGHVGIEGPNGDTFTQDGDYANNTSFGTTGGGAVSNVASRFGSRVYTGVSDTYNPTLGTSRDWVTILGAVKESGGVQYGSATLSGVGAEAAQAKAIFGGVASLSGVAAIAISGIKVLFGGVTASGVGSVAASAIKTLLGAAVMSGSGALSAIGARFSYGTAALSGIGSVAASAIATVFGSAVASGVGALNAAASRITSGASALSGIGSMAASGLRTLFGTAASSGLGALSAIGSRVSFGASTLSGIGLMAASGAKTLFGSTALSGIGSMTSQGLKTLYGVASLSGLGLLSANSWIVKFGGSVLSGMGVLTSQGIKSLFGQTIASSVGQLSADGTVTPGGGGGGVIFIQGNAVFN